MSRQSNTNVQHYPKFFAGETLQVKGNIGVSIVKPGAELPVKPDEDHISPFWQVTVMERCDNRTEDIFQDVNTFNTAIVLQPPRHYHLEITDDPNLYKAGYFIVGAPLIVSQTNNSELVIPLYKFKEGDDIELPFVVGKMVLRQTEHCSVSTTQLQKTDRPHARHSTSSNTYQPEFEEVVTERPRTSGRSSSTKGGDQRNRSQTRMW